MNKEPSAQLFCLCCIFLQRMLSLNMFVTELVVFPVRFLCVFCPPVFCVKCFSTSPPSGCCYCYFNVQYNAYFSRSVFGPGGSKKKIVSEEIIETIEDTYETSTTDPPKKRARISCDANSKSGTQVSVLFIYYFIECHVAGCGDINLLLRGLFHHSSFILGPSHVLT
jgi:hypothetical protein